MLLLTVIIQRPSAPFEVGGNTQTSKVEEVNDLVAQPEQRLLVVSSHLNCFEFFQRIYEKKEILAGLFTFTAR